MVRLVTLTVADVEDSQVQAACSTTDHRHVSDFSNRTVYVTVLIQVEKQSISDWETDNGPVLVLIISRRYKRNSD